MYTFSAKWHTALVAVVLGLTAGGADAQVKGKTKPAGGEKPKTGTPAAAGQSGVGVSLANMDRNVSPCDNFFQFSSGSWMKNNPVPAAETRYGAFDELADRNRAVERRILEKAAADRTAKPGTNVRKVAISTPPR